MTSAELSRGDVVACWILGTGLLGAGIAATFLEKPGAAVATMVLVGSLLLVLALMGRVPLRLEVAGAKLDASFESDKAFDAGRDSGLVEALETAIAEVEEAERVREDPAEALTRLQAQVLNDLFADLTRNVKGSALTSATPEVRTRGRDFADDEALVGYRGPTACRAAGITYRQLDYWARTGLVEPSVRRGETRRYSLQDIVLLRLVKQLLDTGVSLQQIRTAVSHLRDQPHESWRSVTLISNGQSVYQATTSRQVIDLISSGEGFFGISVGRIEADVREELGSAPPSEREDED